MTKVAGPMAHSDASAPPLAGVQVVELDNGYAQYAGKLLADLGARVIKVEPPSGSPRRSAPPLRHGLDDGEHSVPFWYYNVGKQSVVLDLQTYDDRRLLERLIARSDVLLDGLGAGGAESLGLTPEVLGDLSPGVVYVAITPFGLKGPWRAHQATDLVSMALGGVSGQTGYDAVGGAPGEPITPAGGQSLHFAGTLAAISAIAALQEDVRVGSRVLDIAVHDSIAVSTEIPVSMWEFGGSEVFRHTGRHASAAMTTPEWQFRCSDGQYVCALTLYLNDRRFAALRDLFDSAGHAHALADDRYRDQPGREANMQDIVDEIERFCATRPADEIFDEAQKRSLPWAKVLSLAEIAQDEHLHERGFYVPIASSDGTEQIEVPGSPWRGMPTAADPAFGGRRRPPQLGEDTESVLAELDRPG